MFEAFVDEIMDRWQRFPDLHVYHYAPYEPGAIKRLIGRYATHEDEVDRMLHAGVFVDLYSITKQALRASVERYSNAGGSASSLVLLSMKGTRTSTIALPCTSRSTARRGNA